MGSVESHQNIFRLEKMLYPVISHNDLALLVNKLHCGVLMVLSLPVLGNVCHQVNHANFIKFPKCAGGGLINSTLNPNSNRV